jgi:hypothetical protein
VYLSVILDEFKNDSGSEELISLEAQFIKHSESNRDIFILTTVYGQVLTNE